MLKPFSPNNTQSQGAAEVQLASMYKSTDSLKVDGDFDKTLDASMNR